MEEANPLVTDPLDAAHLASRPPPDPSFRTASLDRATSSSRSVSSFATDPFRDTSLDLGVSPFRSPPTSSFGSPAASPRPSLATRPSELARELAAAADDDLPPPAATPPQLSPRSSMSSTRPEAGKDSGKSGSPGLLKQFRTGSGWFAPLVPPDEPLTREQRAAQEKARIDKLKEGRESKASRRPGLLKRMSSGVEMLAAAGRPRSSSGASKLSDRG
ncbi:hypothetical protein JCM8097_004234 [Rhodosporidiobolus ruineniae]